MYKLIATDLDGTLLSDDKTINSKNIQKIKEAQEKGIKFVLASGRVEEAMYGIAKQLDMQKYGGYILSYNGAKIIELSENKVIYSKGLTKKDLEYVFEISKEYEISLVTYINEELYYNFEHEYVDVEEYICGFKKRKYKNLEELDITEVGKCMLIGDTDKTKLLLEKLKDSKYYVTLSDPHFLEILNKDVNKGKSIKKLAEILNIDIKDVITCGDSHNDYDMLKLEGLSVAASNGVKEIKEISDYISVNNNEGILADVIDKYIK